jgi:hypothetical protein
LALDPGERRARHKLPKHSPSGPHKDRKAEASQIDVAATAIGAALVVVSRADRSRRARIRIIVRGSRPVVSPRRITVSLRCSGPVRPGIDRALIAYSNSVNHLASVRVNPPLEKNTAKCVALDEHAIRVRAVYRQIEITSLRNGNRTNRQASKRQSDDDAGAHQSYTTRVTWYSPCQSVTGLLSHPVRANGVFC